MMMMQLVLLMMIDEVMKSQWQHIHTVYHNDVATMLLVL